MMQELTAASGVGAGRGGAGGDPARQRPGLLRRARPERDDRPRRRRSTASCSTVCTELMETIQAIPQPVIAAGAGHRDRRRLPAGGDLRPGGGGRGGALRHARASRSACSARRRWSPLSRAVGAQAGDGDAADRRAISAAEALAAGLVNRVVPAAELAAATRALAGEDRRRQPAAWSAVGKQAFYRQLDDAAAAGLRLRQRGDVVQRAWPPTRRKACGRSWRSGRRSGADADRSARLRHPPHQVELVVGPHAGDVGQAVATCRRRRRWRRCPRRPRR